jgi:pyruvate dehydrogenase E2 component (dihydrolipoamide acetyltransferase)
MSQFSPVEHASSFRRMAAAMWRAPSDPSIYGSMDVDATAALAFLAEHQAATGVRLTVTHLVARAVALALRDQPEINGKIRFWGRLEQRSTIDVFVTVATDGNKDLSGARIDRADEKPLAALARCPMLILVPEIRPRPWVVGDRVEVRPVLRLCATFDHRVIDGAAAGRFANRLTKLFAQPELLA